jgi:hypothetical protein
MKAQAKSSDAVCLARGGMRLVLALSLDSTRFESFHEMLLSSQLDPEKALIVKVLEDGLETFTSGRFARDKESRDRKNKRLEEYREVRRWIFAEDQGAWVFSFAQCCEWLDINPDYMRERCRRYDREVQSGKRQRDTKRRRGLRHEAARANGWGR